MTDSDSISVASLVRSNCSWSYREIVGGGVSLNYEPLSTNQSKQPTRLVNLAMGLIITQQISCWYITFQMAKMILHFCSDHHTFSCSKHELFPNLAHRAELGLLTTPKISKTTYTPPPTYTLQNHCLLSACLLPLGTL